jgi:hypothetical protein
LLTAGATLGATATSAAIVAPLPKQSAVVASKNLFMKNSDPQFAEQHKNHREPIRVTWQSLSSADTPSPSSRIAHHSVVDCAISHSR